MAFLFHGIARLNQVIRGGGGGRGELENGDASSESGRSVDSIRLEEEKALRISEQKELDGKVSSLLEKPGSIKSLVQTLSRLKFQIPPEQSLALFQTLSSCLLQTDVLELIVSEEEDKTMQDMRLRKSVSYVSSVLISFGPINLCQSIASSDKALGFLLDIFHSEEDVDPRVILNVCSVLHAVLQTNPLEVLRAIASRGSDIAAMVYYLDIDAVAELLINILESTCSSTVHPKAFQSALPILSNERIFHLLATRLEECAEDAENDFYCMNTLDNLEFTFRSLVSNLNSKYVKYQTNVAMKMLDIYREVEPVYRMLNAGLYAAEGDSDAHALRVSVKILSGLLDSFKETRTDETMNRLEPIEQVLLSKAFELISIVDEVLVAGSIQPSPLLGLNRLEIVDMFATAFEVCTMVSEPVSTDVPWDFLLILRHLVVETENL
uniref:Uncharacterized protein n=2 Tax=Rhodosorus marinus TaxID=101924 RepID=A0A7S2ZDL0_9RHOD|mmetsp:Transcript_15755/g.64374  ORF Transcript_15755/g.64374 Transcript_15755/m.64374 type:complete len:437 (+) Transcript_15755:115-1425(+)